MPHLYDSGDPNLPDLPSNIAFTNESDEFTDQHSDTEAGQSPVPMERADTHLFGTNGVRNRKRKKRRKRKYSEANFSSTAARQRISWEPGVDIHSTDIIIASIGSAITITDYNKDRYRVEHMEIFTNIQDDSDSEKTPYSMKVEESADKLKHALNSRPPWSKIRWINVNGLSWEAIATIGEKFNLHRLSIEDMIDIPQRTKTDFYPQNVFGVLPLIKLVRETTRKPHLDSRWTRLMKHLNLYDYRQDPEDYNPVVARSLTEQIPRLHEMRRLNDYPTQYSKRRGRLLDDQRPLSYRDLFVGLEQCSFFMRPDGTIISFFESSGDDIENALLSRISAGDTLLRTSCDVSILLQAIIDAIVDITYPVIAAYRKRLSEFELDILMSPDIGHTNTLHLMSGELAKLRRTILPTSSMVNTLRDLSKASKTDTKTKAVGPANMISPICEVYLADIVDHTMMFTDEIEGMIGKIDNLVALIFNTTSTDTNEAMKLLSLITVIFLPLSFWTGYYGMNFKEFGDLDEHVSYYWKVAIPFSVGLLVLISWSFSKSWFVKYRRIFKKRISDIKGRRDIKRQREQEHKQEFV